VRAFSWLAGRVGKDEGGVFFEVKGKVGQTIRSRRLALMAKKDGGLIPSVLAGIVIEEIVKGRLASPGLIPIHTWISAENLVEALQKRGLLLLWQPEGQQTWLTFSLEDLRPYLINHSPY